MPSSRRLLDVNLPREVAWAHLAAAFNLVGRVEVTGSKSWFCTGKVRTGRGTVTLRAEVVAANASSTCRLEVRGIAGCDVFAPLTRQATDRLLTTLVQTAASACGAV